MRSKMWPLALALAASMALGVSGAQAQDTAKDYNAFVFGNYNGTNSDTEGRLAIGGSATLSSYSVGSALGAGGNGQDTLVVGGSLIYTNGSVANGNVVVGGTANSGFTVGNGTLTAGSSALPVNFSFEIIRLKDLSTSLAALTQNGATSYQYGGFTFTGTSSGLNVFNISGADLATANNFKISIPTGSFALFNIDGTTDRMQNFGFSLNGATAGNILYNFSQATSLSLSGIGIQGSVLAPLANTQFNNGNIDGTLIVSALTGSGEMHNVPYRGTLLDAQPITTAVPEPTTWAMLLLGFGMIGFAVRRRGRANPTPNFA